ncbi:MAG: hypothetical protein ABI886_05690 [Betaproteobacteria bacterium]
MMHPALDNLVKIGQLKEEPTSREEISGHLDHPAQCLKDAAVPGISASGRFEFAYTAAHALALAALRANAVRPDKGPGHRAIVFLSLAHTVGAPEFLWSPLNRYHTKRNKSEYGQWSRVTDAEAEDLLKLTGDLRHLVLGWLEANRSELLD